MSSIRARLTLGTLVAVSLFLAIDGVSLYMVVKGRLEEERDRSLTVLANSAGAAVYRELTGTRTGPARINPRYALEGVAFSPFTGDADPNEGAQISAQDLWDRLQLLRDDALVIRTYGVDGGLEDAGWLLHLLGKQAVIGAWVGRDREKNQEQLDTLVRLAKAGDVDVAVIGSEVLLREDLPVEVLIELLREARAKLPPAVPITTAETWQNFLEHPELLAHIDLVYVNYYPYWEGVHIDQAMPTLARWHDDLLEYAQGLPVVVSEAGWPSSGDSVGEAHANPENAARFFLEFVSWARLNDVRYTYFCALDEPWKAKHEGPQGAFWGYRDRHGVLKPGMQDVFDGLLVPTPDPALYLEELPAPGADGDLKGRVEGVGTLTHHVAVLLQVRGVWYTKPSFVAPTVRIASDGSFAADVTTGPGDELATGYAAFLLPGDFVPPLVDSEPEIPESYRARSLASEVVLR